MFFCKKFAKIVQNVGDVVENYLTNTTLPIT